MPLQDVEETDKIVWVSQKNATKIWMPSKKISFPGIRNQSFSI